MVSINSTPPSAKELMMLESKRNYAIKELIEALVNFDRQIQLQSRHYDGLVRFLTKHEKEFPSFTQEFLTQWRKEAEEVNKVYGAARVALEAVKTSNESLHINATNFLSSYEKEIKIYVDEINNENKYDVPANSKMSRLIVEFSKLKQIREKRRKN